VNFSALSIKHPIPAIMLFVLLTLAGILSYRASVVQDFPDIELPIVTVSATLSGAAPAQLETEVARKIEDSVATLQGVKNIYTKVLDGDVTVTVEFILEKPIAEAVNDVRDAVARVRADLPADVRDPSVTKASTAGRVVMTFTAAAAPVSSGRATRLDDQALSWFVDNTVAKRLLSVPGVGAVKRMGGVSREVRIELDADKMAALRVAAIDVSRRLRLVQQEAPGGRGDVSGAEQSVRTIATVKTAAELARLDIPLADGRHIRLDQVATVLDTVAEPRSVATQDGRPVVGFEIFRTKGAGEVDVARGVRAAVDQLQAAHPEVVLTPVIDNAQPVAENFQGSMELLYEGALLAILVVWWFLRDWRATLVAAAALPLSAIPTFLGLHYFGYTLNTVTLLSLALVVGVLVDDAIVEIENIERHLRMGKSPYQAAMDAADEIGMAVIATTFALVAVFLPTAFMGGIPGLFFKQFGWTAVLAILASLVVARLLTPMMAAYILKPHKNAAHADPKAAYHEAPDGWLMARYMATMRWCLRHRAITMSGAAVFFLGSISLVPLLPTGFVPAADRGQTQITIELPPGSTLAETRAVAEQARVAAMTISEIKGVFSSIGGGSSGDAFAPGAAAEARRAVLTLTTSHRNDRSASMADIETQLRNKMLDIPGARFTVGPPDSGVKMQLVLKSDDPVALLASAQKVERELRTLQGVGNISSSASLVRPEIIVRPDSARAADLGVTAAAIGETVRVATAGDYDTSLPKLNLSERQIPIRVKLPDAVRADSGRTRTPDGARQERAGDAGHRGHAEHGKRPGPDRPAQPQPQRDAGRGARPPPARRPERRSPRPPQPEESPARRQHRRTGRRPGNAGLVCQFRHCHADWRAVHLRCAGAAVPRLHAAGHDPRCAPLERGRSVRGPAAHWARVVDAFDDRTDHAHGHRHQELDLAGGLRHPGARRPPGPRRAAHRGTLGALRCAGGRLSQTQPPDRDDLHRHGRRHAAIGPGLGRRPELSFAHGHRRDRRPDHLDAAEPAGGAGGVHIHR
jgi:multidrug efflux pump subunit AcrB